MHTDAMLQRLQALDGAGADILHLLSVWTWVTASPVLGTVRSALHIELPEASEPPYSYFNRGRNQSEKKLSKLPRFINDLISLGFGFLICKM